MIEAWFSSSLMTASCSPSSVSNRPPLASKQEEYKMVSSVPRKAEMRRSSCLCTSWVPQMNLTLASPYPQRLRTSLPAATWMFGPCGLSMTRSALNRPAERISSSSPLISCWTLVNTCRTPHYRCLPVSPGEDHLAALAAADIGEGLPEIGGIELVRDDRGNVEARVDQYRHLVPGLEHLAPVDALDGDHVGDQVRPVDTEVLRGQAEHGNLAAVSHGGQHFPQRARLAGHLKPHIEALTHAEFGHGVTQRGSGSVHSPGHADPPGEIQPVFRHISDDDVPGAGMPGHDRGHETDRASTGDEYVLAQDRK